MNRDELRAVQQPLKERYHAAEEERLATLLRLTERYCVVHQTLGGVPVKVALA
jgi:uncharacterized OsmC-like protein